MVAMMRNIWLLSFILLALALPTPADGLANPAAKAPAAGSAALPALAPAVLASLSHFENIPHRSKPQTSFFPKPHFASFSSRSLQRVCI
jgi:hypothetical protein